MARRLHQPEPHGAHPGPAAEPEPLGPRDTRLELVIAIALGLVAIITAGSVYLNEKQEHKAVVDFHEATHLLIKSNAQGPRTPRGRLTSEASEREFDHAREQQEKATRYTLVEVILASSLFLLGVAGVARETRVKVGALASASIIFVTALVLLATA